MRHDLRAPLVNIRGFAAEIDIAVANLVALVERYGDTLPDKFRDEALVIFREDLHPCLQFLDKSTEQLDDRIDDLKHLTAIETP